MSEIMLQNFIFLLIAGILTGITRALNKKIMLKDQSAAASTSVFMLLNALLASPLLLHEFSLPRSPQIWLLVLLSVVFFAFSTFFIFRAYQVEDLSVVSIIRVVMKY